MIKRLLTTRGRWTAIFVTLLVATGCSSAPATDDDPATEPTPAVDGPGADELEEHPCANPDWDEPPPEPTNLSEPD